MLKFRVTNSMRARRAAEAQRKALEDKLQLEWAWKPMAAMMNEKQTDLVYWIPPLYRNNIKTAGNRVRRRTLAHRNSANRSTINRVPYTQLQAAHMASQRKKKLARRRAKLATEVSFEDPTDTESIVRPRRRSRVAKEISIDSMDPTDTDSIGRVRRRSKLGARVSFENATDTDSAVLTSRSDSKGEWQDTKDEDIESGIHETTDYNADDTSLYNVQSIREEEVRPTGTTMKRRLGEHRRAHRPPTIKPTIPPKPDFITKSFEAIDKPKPAPTLIRLLEKVSHIHCPPVKALKPIKPELRKITRRGSESKSSTKGKVRRPSVKIYGNQPQRLSQRRSKSGLEGQNDLENQCVIVSVDNEALKTPPQKTSPKAPAKASPKPPPKSSPKSPKGSTIPKPPKGSTIPKSPKGSMRISSNKTGSVKAKANATKTGVKQSPKPTPKCFSKASLKSLPKDLQKDYPKDYPKDKHHKTPQTLPQDPPFGILKDPPPYGILKDAPVKPEEAEHRNAQLQMILRLLAQLYEEKVSRQDAEIQNMKARIQTQDKLMKQMAHVVLELKEEISRIKLTTGSRPDIPANVLNIKVGDN